MKFWTDFAEKHPGAAKWIREGGLFVIVSNLITVMKYFILQGLPYVFKDLAGVEFGWPGIPVTLFGQNFDWNIFGYAVKYNDAGQVIVGGGLGYFIAYMIAMGIGEVINFPIQKNDQRGVSTFPRKAILRKSARWASHLVMTSSYRKLFG